MLIAIETPLPSPMTLTGRVFAHQRWEMAGTAPACVRQRARELSRFNTSRRRRRFQCRAMEPGRDGGTDTRHSQRVASGEVFRTLVQ